MVLLAIAIILAVNVWMPPLASLRFHSRSNLVWLLSLAFTCTAVLGLTLQFLADPEVRADVIYKLAYLVAGLVWLRIGLWLIQFLGIDWVTDVLQKNNSAAIWSLSGAVLGFTFCYAGANVGSGPGPEVVVFCAVLASGSLLLAWFFLESLCSFRISESITVERDVASGMRLAFFTASVGLIAGVAVSGDWQSLSTTIWDVARFGWPIALMVLAAASFEIWIRRHPASGQVWQVAIPSLTYVVLSVVTVCKAGLH